MTLVRWIRPIFRRESSAPDDVGNVTGPMAEKTMEELPFVQLNSLQVSRGRIKDLRLWAYLFLLRRTSRGPMVVESTSRGSRTAPYVSGMGVSLAFLKVSGNIGSFSHR